jgi:hypothetical protein
MTLPYYADKAAAEAGVTFPTTEMEVIDLLDRDATRTETGPVAFTVPSASPYQLQVPVMRSQASFVVEVDSNPRVIVRGDAPASGQVGYDPLTGVLTFHSSDSGESAEWTGTPLLTPVLAGLLMRVFAELHETQTVVMDHESRIIALET